MSSGSSDTVAPSPAAAILKVMRLVLPWIGSALLLYWVGRHVDLVQVRQVFHRVPLSTFALLWFPPEALIFVLNVFSFKLLLDWFIKPISFRELWGPVAATYLLGMINPLLGLGGVLVWLNRKKGTAAIDLGGAMLFLAAVDMFFYLILIAIGLFYLDELPQGEVPAAAVRLLSISTLLGIGFYAYFYLFWIRKFDFWVLGFQRRVKAFAPFNLARLWHYGLYLLVRTIFYMSFLIRQYLVMRFCFQVDFPFGRYFGLVPLANALGALPVSVAGYGSTQVVWLEFFREYVNEPLLVALTLTLNSAYTLNALLIGLVGLAKIGWDVHQAHQGASA